MTSKVVVCLIQLLSMCTSVRQPGRVVMMCGCFDGKPIAARCRSAAIVKYDNVTEARVNDYLNYGSECDCVCAYQRTKRLLQRKLVSSSNAAKTARKKGEISRRGARTIGSHNAQ